MPTTGRAAGRADGGWAFDLVHRRATEQSTVFSVHSRPPCISESSGGGAGKMRTAAALGEVRVPGALPGGHAPRSKVTRSSDRRHWYFLPASTKLSRNSGSSQFEAGAGAARGREHPGASDVHERGHAGSGAFHVKSITN